MQLRHYIRLILRWSWLIVLCALICGGATYAVSKKSTPVYEASAYIQVNDISSVGNSGIFNSQAAAVSYAIEVTSNDVYQEVSKELPGVSIDDLASGVSAAPVDNTQLVEVQADAHGPVLAANIANTVVAVFIQQQIAKAVAVDQKAAATLATELITAKADVDNAQAQLTRLQDARAPQIQIQQQADILNTYQLNYDTLFASYSQVQLQENLVASSLTVAQSAVPPVKPKSPNTLLNTILGAAMGLLLTVVALFLYDWVDSTIKTPQDVAQLALLEPLGSVPLRRRAKGKYSKNLANDSAVEQAFVAISTSFKAVGAGKRAILVTGLRSGSGVSLAASRLAIALTQSGSRVLLVDANLSRPMQHVIFNTPNTRGLTNELDSLAISPTQSTLPHGWWKQWASSVPNLYLLPAGPQFNHAEPIQLTLRLQVLTEWLLHHTASSSLALPSSDEIDIIIFDAPALDQGPGTIALAPITDSTVLVIEAGKERADALHRAQATLQRLGSPIVGVIINRQQAKHQTYFYAQRPQQLAVHAEHAYASAEPKYPSLRTRTAFSQQLPEMLNTPGEERALSLNGTAQRAASPTPTIPDTPDIAIARASTLPLTAFVHPDTLSRRNSFRPGEDQGRRAR